MKEQQKFATFLEYSQLIYNYLSIHHIDELSVVNACRWIRRPEVRRMTFKYMENMVCIGGEDHSSNGLVKGIVATYYVKTPLLDQLDDNRLRPSVIIKNRFEFPTPITIVEQFACHYPNSQCNNNFALAAKNNSQLMIIPSESLTSQQKYPQLSEASQSFLTLPVEHTDQITKIRWANSKNSGYKLLTASKDKSLIQWDLEKMKIQRSMKYHRDVVNDLTPLHDYSQRSWTDGPEIDTESQICSVSSDGYAYLWDNRQKNPTNRINCRQKEIYSIACVSKHSIITGGNDGNIKFWDLKQNREFSYDNQRQKCQGHKQKVTKLEMIRPPGYKIKESQNHNIGKINFISGGDDGKIIIWQEKIHFVHEGHQSEITDFDHLEDINHNLSSCKGNTKLMIWQEGIHMGIKEK